MGHEHGVDCWYTDYCSHAHHHHFSYSPPKPKKNNYQIVSSDGKTHNINAEKAAFLGGAGKGSTVRLMDGDELIALFTNPISFRKM